MNQTFLKPAFSLLELILVILILGILSSLVLPHKEKHFRQEAADNILADIRYTQYLALMDNKHLFDKPNWHKRFWKIMFGTCRKKDHTLFYMIGSDNDMTRHNTSGIFRKSEAARDPINGKAMFWTNGRKCNHITDNSISHRIFITKKYGITQVKTSGGCKRNRYLGFDHLGRPHNGFTTSMQPNYKSYLSKPCIFTFVLRNDETFSIVIQPETGYAFVEDK